MPSYFLGVLAGVGLGALISTIINEGHMKAFEQEAFDRGYMIQCVGKEGYYWECDP